MEKFSILLSKPAFISSKHQSLVSVPQTITSISTESMKFKVEWVKKVQNNNLLKLDFSDWVYLN